MQFRDGPVGVWIAKRVVYLCMWNARNGRLGLLISVAYGDMTSITIGCNVLLINASRWTLLRCDLCSRGFVHIDACATQQPPTHISVHMRTRTHVFAEHTMTRNDAIT